MVLFLENCHLIHVLVFVFEVCDHTVIGRVRIKRVLNPSSWFDRSTYLRAETEAIEDTDDTEDCWKLEGEAVNDGMIGFAAGAVWMVGMRKIETMNLESTI